MGNVVEPANIIFLKCCVLHDAAIIICFMRAVIFNMCAQLLLDSRARKLQHNGHILRLYYQVPFWTPVFAVLKIWGYSRLHVLVSWRLL